MLLYNDKYLTEILKTLKGKYSETEKTMERIHRALLMTADIHYVPKYSNIEKTAFFKTWNPKEFNESIDDDQSLRCRDPERELFVYSLLFMRHQLSLCFWEDMPCKTSGALFAMLLTKAMLESSAVKVDINLKNLVEKMQKDYERKAIGLLNACYAFSPKTSHIMLKIQHDCWGQKTCLDLAEQADSKMFIAQSGCQTLVQEVWLGKISDRNSTWKILLATFFPAFVYGIWFTHDTHRELEKLRKISKSLNVDRNGSILSKQQIDATNRKSSAYVSNEGSTNSVDKKTLVPKESVDSVAQVEVVLSEEISLADRYKFFYTAPIVTFILNVASKLALIILFSYVILAGMFQIWLTFNFISGYLPVKL